MKWSYFICRRCQKRLFEKHPNANGCDFECFDGVGSCFPDRPHFLKGGNKSKKRILIYVPYGEQWEKEVMKMKKKDIVQMLRRVCKRRDEFEKLYLDVIDNVGTNDKKD